MATTDEIVAAVETAQTAVADALATLITDTGVAVESVELVDVSSDPPTVKINVALAVDEGEATEPEPPKQATTLNEHFGV